MKRYRIREIYYPGGNQFAVEVKYRFSSRGWQLIDVMYTKRDAEQVISQCLKPPVLETGWF